MNDNNTVYEGGCLCGAVRYQISGPLDFTANCHCRSCQRALGAAFATWSVVKEQYFEVIKGQIKLCETSSGIERGFCGNCGTSLTYDAHQEVDGQDFQGQAWFLAATLDDPSIALPKTHVYVSHQQPWVKLNDGLPTFEQF